MEVKFHINLKKGTVGKCEAKIKDCPVGGAHFATKIEAEGFKEEALSQELGLVTPSLSRKSNIDKNVEVLHSAVSQTLNDATVHAMDDCEKDWETAVADGSKVLHLPGRLKVPAARGLPENMTIDEFDEQHIVSQPLCGECDEPLGPPSMTLALSNGQSIYCENCESVNALHDGTTFERVDAYIQIDLNENSDTYAAFNKENVKDMVWYHVTDNPHWEEDIQHAETGADRVHAGGVMASLDRMYQKYYYDNPGEPPTLYMYQIELDDDIKITEDILEDRNDDLEFIDAIDEHKTEFEEDAHVVRYVNKWEDPGSISLSIDSQKMKVRSVRTVLKDDFNSPAKMFFKAADANDPEIYRREQLAKYANYNTTDDYDF